MSAGTGLMELKVSQTLKLGDREFYLMPVSGSTTRQSRAQRSELQLFDSEPLPEYRYKKLPGSEKRIRLLQLRSGTTHGSEIFCELIQADYDNIFHIPTRLDGGGDVNRYKGRADAAKSPEEEKLGAKGRRERERLENHRQWEDIESKKIEYEALSWCWGQEAEDYALKIEENGKTYKKRARKELALALKYLRLPDKTRTLWIDAICINQEDHEERNHQVQMMSRVYTRAKEVCIWLGEDTDQSKTAIDFIHQEIMELKNFDTICSDKRYTEKWQALMMLMQRDWFSRRWVVQEIALATKARLYCGPDSIPWKEFAVAVKLFVEVETASHRLSEIMQKDEKFRHIPNWFEHVSELGASLLVQATGKVFRAQRTPMQDDPADILRDEDRKKYERDQKKHKKELKKQMLESKTIDPLDRRGLLSLEYLVSTMFIFKATEPRDVVYSLLAIAREAAPFAHRANLKDRDGSFLTVSLLNAFLEEKPFVVDYNRPYADVCRDFVEFCIHRKFKLDPVQALDILCRPWALEPQPGKSIRVNSSSQDSVGKKHRIFPERDGTQKKLLAEYIMNIKSKSTWDDGWKIPKGWDEIRNKYFPDKMEEEEEEEDEGEDIGTDQDDDRVSVTEKEDLHEKEDKLLRLPSWVNRASKAPFNLYLHTGQAIHKTGRAAADPLVGHPQDGHRNYSAAQTRPVDLKALKFRRRPQLGHYSLYVTGFELDEVKIVKDASQGGNIPKAWLDLAGWEAPYSHDPPDKFWRTLVGDRGRDNRNPPYYYARACKESVHKGGIASNSVNTSSLIDHERNSIVAEYCRRVQSVIWGRRLFETKRGQLGLAPDDVQQGDKICILYGCTVPVILRMHKKTEGDIENEAIEDKVEHLKSLIQKWEQICIRKAACAPKKKRYQETGEWGKIIDAKSIAEKALKNDAQRLKGVQKKDSDSSLDEFSNLRETPPTIKHDDDTQRPKITRGTGSGKSHSNLQKPSPSTRRDNAQKPKIESNSGSQSSSRETPPSTENEEDKKDKASEVQKEEQSSQPKPGKLKRSMTTYQENKITANKEGPLYYCEFIGESYLHGMMDGEALREKFYLDIADRVFELR
ncbi:heterokaryon incompatibility protein-domain-containing protein [Nemania sp. FL0031]|nr:heterokaryon incompatibility protein-domain-containing protein [Nemania sp. FL0031]